MRGIIPYIGSKLRNQHKHFYPKSNPRHPSDGGQNDVRRTDLDGCCRSRCSTNTNMDTPVPLFDSFDQVNSGITMVTQSICHKQNGLLKEPNLKSFINSVIHLNETLNSYIFKEIFSTKTRLQLGLWWPYPEMSSTACQSSQSCHPGNSTHRINANEHNDCS